jgi:hypothetical protein
LCHLFALISTLEVPMAVTIKMWIYLWISMTENNLSNQPKISYRFLCIWYIIIMKNSWWTQLLLGISKSKWKRNLTERSIGNCFLMFMRHLNTHKDDSNQKHILKSISSRVKTKHIGRREMKHRQIMAWSLKMWISLWSMKKEEWDFIKQKAMQAKWRAYNSI